MTTEQLKEFGEGNAFIDMKDTNENDWYNLMIECSKVGIDLNERAITYYAGVGYAPPGFNFFEAFVCYAKNRCTKTNTYLKCSGDKLTTWNTNVLGLPIYNLHRAKCRYSKSEDVATPSEERR